MTKEKKKKTWWQILLIVVGSVVGALLVVVGAFSAVMRLTVNNYYSISQPTFYIPDIDNGFIPQGLTYDEATDNFFVTGYQNDNSASPIYLVNKTDGTQKKVLMANEDGSVYHGHCGGLSVHGGYVYVASGRGLIIYSYEAVLNAENGATLNAIGSFSTSVSDNDYVSVSFTTVHDGKLYVGEFFRKENYPTLDSHKITTSAGDNNTALLVAFNFNANKPFGLEEKPNIAYSLPGLVQGMCFNDGKVYLSTSYGLDFSHIYEYTESDLAYQKEMTVLGTSVPLYAFDSASLVADHTIAPMSEEIEIVDGMMYVMCESASNKYIFGKFTFSNWCYATEVSKW